MSIQAKRVFVAIAGLSVTVASLASPAIASPEANAKAVVFGIGHSLTPADIAPALGSYRAAYDGTAFRNYTSTWSVCSFDSGDRSVGFSGMNTEIRLRFVPQQRSSKQRMGQSIFQFSNPAAAKRTFAKLQKDVKGCRGTTTDAVGSDNPEDAILWSGNYSNGTLNAVASAPTIYVDYDWTRTLGSTVANRVDEFSTYSLVGDAIIGVFYQRTPDGKATAKEREGARVTTAAAIRNYQRSTPPKSTSVQGQFAANSAALVGQKEIPSTLGSRWVDQDISLTATAEQIWLCDPDNIQFAEPGTTGRFIGIKASPVQVRTSVDGPRNGVGQAIYEFKDARAASAAFSQMANQAKRCAGTTRQDVSGVSDEDGQPFSGSITRSYQVTRPSVSANTPSIAITLRQSVVIPAGSTPNVFGEYDIYTLDGARIALVQVYASRPISAQQRSGALDLSKRLVTQLPH
jgi:hypothetical protein